MKNTSLYQRGLSIVEFMIAIAIGLFLIGSLLAVFLAQTQTYTTTASQGFTQNAENAISAMITPYIRGAGFAGCATTIYALSNLNAGTSAPLSLINTTPSMVMGYQANTTTIAQHNAANSATGSGWLPTLDSTLVGNVEPTSDVLVLLGPIPGSYPTGVTTYSSSSSSFTVQSASGVSAGQFGSISDCAKASIFLTTSVSGTTITHVSGSGTFTNAASDLAVNYPIGAQFIPMQQTAFFVGQGLGNESSLMIATLNGSSWTVSPLIPGVDTMKVLYGIGSNGVPTQYVSAGSVTNWGEIYAIRIGFLIEGQSGSGNYSNANPTQFTILGQTITVPADNRLRHVFELGANVRNTIS